MSHPFPDDPFLRGNYAPWLMEGEIYDLVIEGEIPRELDGTLSRNGPNPQFAPRGRYHWFDGDGMVHAFTLRQTGHRREHYLGATSFTSEPVFVPRTPHAPEGEAGQTHLNLKDVLNQIVRERLRRCVIYVTS